MRQSPIPGILPRHEEHFRPYATEVPRNNSNTNVIILSTLAAVAGVGGAYYYLNERNSTLASSTPKQSPNEIPTPHPREEQKNVRALSSDPRAVFTGGEQGWVDLKLQKVETLNHNTKRFRFLLPEEDDISGLKVASAMLVKYQGPGQDKPVIRPYTPVSDEDAKGYIDLMIKRYANGPMSEHLHSMKPDQRLLFKGPVPKYAWEANKHEHIGLIAGGTGITPMYQLCRAIFNNPADKTKVTVVFGNIAQEDILLKHELEELENTYPQRFRAFYVLSHPAEGWTGGVGKHIDAQLLKTVLPDPNTKNIKLFVCGPPAMYQAISGPKKSIKEQGELSGILKDLGYDKEQVYKF
ncbi:MAG: NADH-cytochrome b5 reductase [Phylliscum demangeonii]|nr:MAG: NADH-cytochrome b5 reductase [Phylliscum demangeonii]